MRFYPQLQTGATVQHPLLASSFARTVENELPGGRRRQWSDEPERWSRWVCAYQDLLPAEWNALRQLFDDCEGRLGEFVFPDPLGNLLVWSQEFSRPGWVATGLSFQGSVPGPMQGSNGTRLAASGAGAGELLQTVFLPGWYVTTLSLWVRSSSGGAVELVRRSGSVTQSVFVRGNGNWTRVSLSGATSGGPEPNQFGVAVPAGGTVEIFGAQLEAQPAPSSYKPTSATGGLFLAARFDTDELQPTMTATNKIKVAVPIVARRGV